MDTGAAVTAWLRRLNDGDAAGVQPLWEHYFERLVRLARKKLAGVPRRIADEEDVALSAFDSFCAGVKHGRFPHLDDRHNLWSILITLTQQKAFDLAKYQSRQKRKGVGESALFGPDGSDSVDGMANVPSPQPSPDFAAQVAEECKRLLELLGDDNLRTVAVMKMEGYTVPEI